MSCVDNNKQQMESMETVWRLVASPESYIKSPLSLLIVAEVEVAEGEGEEAHRIKLATLPLATGSVHFNNCCMQLQMH